MASVSTSKETGLRSIQFTGLDGKRRTLRLGKCPLRDARTIGGHVEEILNAALRGSPMARPTATWLADLPMPMLEKLAGVGLVESPRNKVSARLDAFLGEYIAKRANTKESSKLVFGRARKHLVEFFGPNRKLDSITQGNACDWRQSLIGKNMADATVRKMCGIARQFFKAAIQHRLIPTNPFDADEIKTTVRGNTERFRFVTRDETEKLIAACPNEEWKLIVGLSRWGGLRCPSEHLALTWDHVNWAEGKLTVPSPKTAHHEGHGERIIPLFPELRTLLDAAYDKAPEGATFILTRRRGAKSNLRTQLLRIIRRAGIEPWERLFHNLRASRQTELADAYPEHVVSRWLGNSVAVARKHYLNTLDAHFERAVSASSTGDVKSDAVSVGNASHCVASSPPEMKKPLENKGFRKDQWTIQDSNL
jgi:integrase